MRRILLLLVLSALAFLALLPGLANAQVDVDAMAADLRADGYYVEEGTYIDSATKSALDEASIPIYLVVLASDPGEDPSLTAQRIGELFGSGTFVVRTPDFIGIYSVDYDEATVESALDGSLDGWRESNADGIKALDRELTGTGAFPTGKVILGALAALIGWGIYRGKKSAKVAASARMDERRSAISEQADDVANDILALSDRVQMTEDRTITDHYRSANEIFSTVQDSIATAATEMEFEQLSSRLTEAEWHLEAVEALLDGRPVPEQPTDRPVECFFHQHKAGVERAELETPAGSQVVSVCRDCAERLRRGESPEPRQVVVAGSRMPAGRAPRSYGGGGLGSLDVFDVMLGTGRASYDWRAPRPRPARTVARSSRSLSSTRSASRSSSRSVSRSSSRSSSSKRGGGRASRRL